MAARTPYDKIRGKTLRAAWWTIRASGLRSLSQETQNEVREFEVHAEQSLARIDRKLLKGKFTFNPQRGLLLKKGKGKGRRPVVLAPIENRIVQRAMLDVLQEHASVRELFEHAGSFGGIPKRDVRDALALAVRTIRDNRPYYVSSDIHGFFTKIPRDVVVNEVAARVADERFRQLLEDATTTTLDNLARLGPQAKDFPLTETGVAQGSPLSALLANTALYHFDRQMNDRGITCIRYLDDFLILAETLSKANSAFRSAQRILGDMGMEAYEPSKSPAKASRGDARQGLDFLGCTIQGSSVIPSKKAREHLIRSVDEALSTGVREMRVAADQAGLRKQRRRFVQTLAHVDRMVNGWANAYSFCRRRSTFESIDADIDKLLDDFIRRWGQLSKGLPPSTRRRILGVHILLDTPYRSLEDRERARREKSLGRRR